VTGEEGDNGQQRGAHQEATHPTGISDLVAAASAGDSGAWERLYPAVASWVGAVGAGLGMGREDVADVNQIVCLRLVDHLGRLRAPEALRGWVVTVTRHECYRVLRERRRQDAVGLDPTGDIVDRWAPTADERLLRTERHDQLRAAFVKLSEDCQRLLRLLAADPPLSYADAASVLGRPIGAIGPSRQRCLSRLRTLLDDAVGEEGTGDPGSPAAGAGRRPSNGSARDTNKSGRPGTKDGRR
jgi:RNA polymerase sigma factor (sigma-70 family)